MISFFTNPGTLVLGLLLLGSSLAYGVKVGRDMTEHRVVTLQAQHAATLAKIEKDSAAAVAQKAKEAEDAANTVPVPQTPTEIAALCQRSASCRERQK